MNRKTGGTDINYNEVQVLTRLRQDLPYWYLEAGNICRKYKTGGWKSSLMVVNAIGHLAEVAWHHPDIELSYALVLVKLQTHSANGITNKDFELAGKIEQLICWQPGLDNTSALDGIPVDERFTYINPD